MSASCFSRMWVREGKGEERDRVFLFVSMFKKRKEKRQREKKINLRTREKIILICERVWEIRERKELLSSIGEKTATVYHER